jgi:hypothetical protein
VGSTPVILAQTKLTEVSSADWMASAIKCAIDNDLIRQFPAA